MSASDWPPAKSWLCPAGIAADGDLRLTGEAITTAARIQSMARPGEILLDERPSGPLAAGWRPTRGAVVLRGQSTAVELHILRGEAGAGPDPVPCRDAGTARRARPGARRHPRGA